MDLWYNQEHLLLPSLDLWLSKYATTGSGNSDHHTCYRALGYAGQAQTDPEDYALAMGTHTDQRSAQEVEEGSARHTRETAATRRHVTKQGELR